MLVAMLCAAVTGAWAETVTDELTQTWTGVTNTSYTEWSNKKLTSNAVYAGQSAGGNSSIQLRSNNNNSGVVTTTSGGKVKSITVEWQSSTSSGRTLNVYGKNSAYSAATDLYNTSNQGTLLGTIVCGTSTSLTISGDYEYIGFRSASGAMYLTSVSIVWEETGGGSQTETVATPTFNPEAGTYSSAQNVTISCGTQDATIYYSYDNQNWTAYTNALNIDENKTVYAKAEKNGMDNSAVASAKYTIVNIEHAGTEQDPYTVADARNAIDANTGITDVYATGKVSEIVTAYDSGHGYITFDIIDEGGSNTLRAYHCGGSEAANIQLDDVVVISGDLTLYSNNSNTIYEFSSGCTLVSRTSSSTQVAAGLSYSPTSAEADLADLSSFTAPTLTNPHSLEITYTSSDPTVATVASDGTVTPLAKGTTTITATSEETSQYLAGEAHYTLTVTNSNAALVTVDASGNTTFDFTDNGWGFPDNSNDKLVSETSYTNNGYTIKVAGSTGNGFYFFNSVLLMGKSGAYLTLPEFDYDVEKIEVVGGSGASTSVVQNIYVGDHAVSTATTGAKDVTNTYLINEAYKEAGTIYTLKVTSAHNTQISSIKVYKAAVDNRTPVTLTFTGVPATIVKDETATYTVTASPAVTGITYSSSDGDIVMVDENTGEIGALALGRATITATFAGDATYKPATASYVIEVVAPKHTAKFFVNGIEQTSAEEQVSEGAAIPFPTATETIDGKTFIGWTTAAITTAQSTAPATLVNSATMGNADVNYYAVYATASGGGSTTATLTESEITTNFTNTAMAYNNDPKSYNDTSDGITWTAKAYATKDSPWIQLRKNATVAYLKISATGNISSLKFTISNTTTGTGQSTSEIDNHGEFTGSIVLLDEATANATEGTLGSTNAISNNEATITPTSSVSELYVQVTAGARIWGVEVTYGSASYSDYCTTVTTPEDVDITIGSVGYSTLYYSDRALVVPAGVEAYTYTVTNNKLDISRMYDEDETIPAGTAVVLKASEGNYTFAVSSQAGDIDEDNILKGTDDAATTTGGSYYYALSLNAQNEASSVGFYWMEDNGAAFTCGAHKAYIALNKTFAELASGGTQVKSFFTLADIETAIKGIEANTENGVIYNLAGQRLSKPVKGVNIINGRKVIVK